MKIDDMNKSTGRYRFAILCFFALLLLGGLAVSSYLQEQQASREHALVVAGRQTIKKQRDDSIYELSQNFNNSITRADKQYGYSLFSPIARSSRHLETFKKYRKWAKQLKSAFPQLGTKQIVILHSNRDSIDVMLTDQRVHFILEVDETDGVYSINEIRTYAAEDKPDRKNDGYGCYLIFQTRSDPGKDCPVWQ